MSPFGIASKHSSTQVHGPKENISLKYCTATSATFSQSSSHLPCGSIIPWMRFLCHCWDAFVGKNLVFLSPCLIQLTRDLCAQYISCLLSHSSSSILTLINSSLFCCDGGAQFNSSIRFCKPFISFVPGCVFVAPHTFNSEEHPLIFFLTVSKAYSPIWLISQASLITVSQSSHKSQTSSNLNPRCPLLILFGDSWF